MKQRANSAGSVGPVQGSVQWNSPSESHFKDLTEIWTSLDRGWQGKFTIHVAITHPTLHTKGTKNSLLFTLPYLLFILLQNFTQTIANLHTAWNTEGHDDNKIKSIFHPKGINNIKDKLFFFKTDTFIWNNILLLQKINKSSKEFLIFYESFPSSGT